MQEKFPPNSYEAMGNSRTSRKAATAASADDLQRKKEEKARKKQRLEAAAAKRAKENANPPPDTSKDDQIAALQAQILALQQAQNPGIGQSNSSSSGEENTFGGHNYASLGTDPSSGAPNFPRLGAEFGRPATQYDCQPGNPAMLQRFQDLNIPYPSTTTGGKPEFSQEMMALCAGMLGHKQPAMFKGNTESGPNSYKLEVNQEIKSLVESLTTEKVWPRYKFLSNDDQVFEVAKIIFPHLPQLTPALPIGDEGARVFVKTYGDTICSQINGLRTNAATNLRKALVKYGTTKGKKAPTVDQLRRVILRQGMELVDADAPEAANEDEDPAKTKEIDQNFEWFRWYWDELLPKVTGKGRWGGNIRRYGTISEFKYPDSEEKYVSSTDEAMVLLCFENGERRFKYYLDCAKENPPGEVDHNDERFQTRWSNSSAGQNKFGGWTPKGRQRFSALCKTICRAKKSPHVKAVEEHTLRLIRRTVGLEDSDDEDAAPTLEATEFAPDAAGCAGGWEGSDQETEGEGAESELEALEDVYIKCVKKKKGGKKKKKGGKKNG